MTGFTVDGQADPAMVVARDQRFGLDSAEKRKSRAGIAAPAIDPSADGGQHGKGYQIDDATGRPHAVDVLPTAPGAAGGTNAGSRKP